MYKIGLRSRTILGRWFALAPFILLGCGQATNDQTSNEPVTIARTDQALAASGTWTTLPTNSVTGIRDQVAVLLTDGSVLFQSAADQHVWTKLTPDASGNYSTGTWSPVAPSAHARMYYPYAVLKDGRLFVAGGEYHDGTDSATAEIYDPVSNTWTSMPDSPLGDISDVPSQVLPDGRIIMGYRSGVQTEIFDPTTSSWSQGGDKPSNVGTEETWSLLPTGAVLNWSPSPSQLYIPAQNTWVNAATPPVVMQNPQGAEIGPGVFMPNGKLLALSAFGNTALYTPGATATDPGSWALGPNLPRATQSNSNPNGLQYAEDVPACIEPDGKVLLVSSNEFGSEANFSEYDPTSNTITAIPAPFLPAGWSSYYLNFVALPNGQILLTGTGTDAYVYTPVGTPQAAWRPTVQSVTANTDGSYTVSGTQLNGLSLGASYGDEGAAQTNFPLVRLTSGTTVRYARTYAFSSMDFATGSAPVQARFTLPADIPQGTYQLSAVANGIASSPVNFTVGSGNHAPAVSLTSPADNASFSAPAQVTINANASDSDGTISKVEFYQCSTLLGTDTSAPYSFLWSNVAAGSYALTAKAYDNANASTTSSMVNIVVNPAGGNNPCAGFCSPAAAFAGPTFQSGNLGTEASCRETSAVLHGGNCSNFYDRTLKVNGVTMNCNGWTLPAAHNGGFCVQVSAGSPEWSSFATW